jgi:DNA-binding MarR family transcriptional regulator
MTSRKPVAVDHLPDHLPRWLEAATRRLYADLALAVAARGAFPDVRGSQRRILQMIPPDGIRITDLAALAGMTKQALGEFVDTLESAGYVGSRSDERDRRVRLVSRTTRGDEAAEASSAAIASVESAWRAEIGPARYDAMMSALRELGRDGIGA